MPIRTLLFAGALAAGCFAPAGTALAQTCAAPQTWPSPDPPGSSPALDVNTCLGDPPTGLCAFGYESGGPAATVVWHHDPACMQHLGPLHVSAYESNVTPTLFLSNQPDDCGGEGGSCVGAGDSATPISFDGLPAGTYQIMVTSTSGVDQPGACGWVRLAFDGYIDTEGACSGEDIVFRDDFEIHVIGRPPASADVSLADVLRRTMR